MKFSDFLKYDEDLTLQKKTVVILRWIALIGQLITVYVVHFFLDLNLWGTDKYFYTILV